jgi:hypothetical protein
MDALISVFVAISLSLLVTRIATEALALTGLSRTSASFQARSAFTGSGFTTQESEAVVQHPVRRRIVVLVRVHAGKPFVLRLTPMLCPCGTRGRTACG